MRAVAVRLVCVVSLGACVGVADVAVGMPSKMLARERTGASGRGSKRVRASERVSPASGVQGEVRVCRASGMRVSERVSLAGGLRGRECVSC